MDVADIQTGQAQMIDVLGDRTQKLFQTFLEAVDVDTNEMRFLEQAQTLKDQSKNLLRVNYGDVQEFSQELANVITEQYYRVYPFLCRAVKNFMRDHVDAGPEISRKEFYVAFEDVPTRLKVRELTTEKIGELIRISGQVVRTHPVHPELTRGTFTCEDCKSVVKDVVQQFKYTLPTICSNAECQNKRRFDLNSDESTFVDFQKIRVQETQAELPRGAIPRTLEVIVHAEAVETCQAGDRCDFIGTLIVVPDVGSLSLEGIAGRSMTRNRQQPEGANDTEGVSGLKELGVRDLHYRLAFLACNIQQSNRKIAQGEWELDEITIEAMQKQMNPHEWNRLFDMSGDKNLYTNLTESLFPTIHGNVEIKQGILLQLFGGVPKVTEEKTSLRGDINVCIVGDPSTAKSQFLRQVAEFNPRGVYTSGKASSAAGLTAAVVKDEESYEFVIEAGALMLADNGVCCIDEFDKMDTKDQVAIHEAMEQQTISITKAGIKATLNARTSILAAANPKGGRYNQNLSLRNNVNMEAPIISRFDLFFILTDEANEVHDYAIARKIVDLHAQLEDSVNRVYTQEEILRYIMFARQFKPQIGKEAAARLILYYKLLRQRDTGATRKHSNRVTVRQLESMVRLSEAYARLHLSDVVELKHVEEAYRLINKSIIRVNQGEVEFDREEPNGMDEDEEEIGVEGMAANLSNDDMDVQETELDESTLDCSQPRRRAENLSQRSTAESVLGSETGTDVSRGGRGRKLKMSYDDYRAKANLLLHHMRREDERVAADGGEYGLRRSAIVNWYLTEIEDDIDSEAELVEQKELIEKILDRLVNNDKVILKLVTPGLGQEAANADEADPMLATHPNYDFDG